MSDFYVDGNVVGPGIGSYLDPFDTIQAGIDAAEAGGAGPHTVHIRGDSHPIPGVLTYSEAVTIDTGLNGETLNIDNFSIGLGWDTSFKPNVDGGALEAFNITATGSGTIINWTDIEMTTDSSYMLKDYTGENNLNFTDCVLRSSVTGNLLAIRGSTQINVTLTDCEIHTARSVVYGNNANGVGNVTITGGSVTTLRATTATVIDIDSASGNLGDVTIDGLTLTNGFADAGANNFHFIKVEDGATIDGTKCIVKNCTGTGMAGGLAARYGYKYVEFRNNDININTTVTTPAPGFVVGSDSTTPGDYDFQTGLENVTTAHSGGNTTVTQTDGFVGYAWKKGDLLTITDGSITAGLYEILSKTSDDVITIIGEQGEFSDVDCAVPFNTLTDGSRFDFPRNAVCINNRIVYSGSTFGHAIFVPSNVQNVLVFGNYVDSDDFGIVLKGIGVECAYNEVHGKACIYLSGCHNTVVHNNTIRATDTAGILFAASQIAKFANKPRVFNNDIQASGSGVACLSSEGAENDQHGQIYCDYNKYSAINSAVIAKFEGSNHSTLAAVQAAWLGWSGGAEDFIYTENDANSNIGHGLPALTGGVSSIGHITPMQGRFYNG